jgi:hypothetical protein
MSDTRTAVEQIREAARLMRDRAQAAEPFWAERRLQIGIGGYSAPHIVSWHPAVALAVADLLELIAAHTPPFDADDHAALAVATAYLGSGS